MSNFNRCLHMCASIGNIPSSYVDAMSYEEQLLWLCKFIEEKIYPALDDLSEYVDKKIEDMAESGELAEIIAQYIQLHGVLAYNTVSDMKSATNLVNGSVAKTLGYTTKNDGGSSLYLIRTVTTDDTIDEIFIIKISDTLVAELILTNNTINLLQAGCKGDGTTDNATIFQTLVNNIPVNSTIYVPKGIFYLSTSITMKSNISIIGDETSTYNSMPTSAIKFESDGFNGRYNYSVENINLLSDNKTGKGLNDGEVSIKNCHIKGFGSAIYTFHTGVIENCHIYDNNTGIDGIIDSRVVNNFIYNNTNNGIRLYMGCNDNIITNNKIEWNGQHGIEIYIANYNIISNNIFDRNTKYGIEMKGATNTNITGNTFKRNYIDNTADNSHAHVLIYESHFINFSNNNTIKANSLDDGTGVEVPFNALSVYSSDNVNIISNCLKGATTLDVTYDGNISNILRYDTNKHYGYANASSISIDSSTSGTISLTNLGVPNQNALPISEHILVQAKTGNSGGCAFLETEVFAYKGWASNELYIKNNALNDQVTISCAYDGDTPKLTFTSNNESWNITVLELQ